jgi:hypothetical protein
LRHRPIFKTVAHTEIPELALAERLAVLFDGAEQEPEIVVVGGFAPDSVGVRNRMGSGQPSTPFG